MPIIYGGYRDHKKNGREDLAARFLFPGYSAAVTAFISV
jgi:hypothetical protein